MKISDSTIELHGLQCYAYHGVLPQERRVGAMFVVDLTLYADYRRAILNDQLAGTVNYADVYALVQKEMAAPSALLEHVAGRTAQAILNQFPTVQRVAIRLTKQNPPMGGVAAAVGVAFCAEREEP